MLCGCEEITSPAPSGESLFLQGFEIRFLLPLATPSPAQTHPEASWDMRQAGEAQKWASTRCCSQVQFQCQGNSGLLGPKTNHYNEELGFPWRPGNSVAKAACSEPLAQGLANDMTAEWPLILFYS